MLSFNFYCPTRYIFGKDAMDHFAEALDEQKAKRILVMHYGSKEEMGFDVPEQAVKDVKRILEETGREYIEFTGIVPNPVLSTVRRGIEVCREYKPDLILAIGGASVIDTAKAVGAGSMLDEGEDVWADYIFKKKRFKRS